MKRRAVGEITRGTTNPNRLRRVDRYLVELEVLRKVDRPVLVDLGYGKTPVTAFELLERVRKRSPGARVLGVEIDRERVASAKDLLQKRAALPGSSPEAVPTSRGSSLEAGAIDFVHGGFEIPLPDGWGSPLEGGKRVSGVAVIRALNVLRQYDEAEVARAWGLMRERLVEGGRVIEGTCDELGRLATWVTLDRGGPLSLTISLDPLSIEKPSDAAERLIKALIHRNVPGENIYEFFRALDAAWSRNASIGALSPRQRWVASCAEMAAEWPLQSGPLGGEKRWKLGEITVAWDAIKPR